jgi:hypothetical protein
MNLETRKPGFRLLRFIRTAARIELLALGFAVGAAVTLTYVAFGLVLWGPCR